MSMPRPVHPGTTYLFTRRCAERRFFLRPSAVVAQVLIYCLALAARRHGVLVHAVVALSNHVHALITDTRGELPAFAQLFLGLVARCMNVHHERGEAFWASGCAYSAVTLGDADAVIDKLGYLISNATAAGLVATPEEWPGLRTLAQDMGTRTLAAERPRFFFRSEDQEEDGADDSARARARRRAGPRDVLPPHESVDVTVPPQFAHMPEADFRALVQRVVDERVRDVHAARQQRGLTRFLGVDAILAQDPSDTPGGTMPDGSLNPRVACKDKWRRIQMLQGLAAFWQAHREAYLRFRAGQRQVLFPAGTYGARVFYGARCAPARAGPVAA